MTRFTRFRRAPLRRCDQAHHRRLHVEPLEARRVLATYFVANLSDGPVAEAGDLPGSLRQAIFDANANSGTDTIEFAPGVIGTISLTEGELAITDSVTLNGPGAADLTIDGQSNSRVVNIDDGDNAVFQEVMLDGVKLTRGNVGYCVDTGCYIVRGGGVINYENLSITNTTVSGNSATGGGGGVSSRYGSLTVTNSTFADNLGSEGGGIRVREGELTIIDSIISNNSLREYPNGGGGIRISHGQGTVIGSTISGNGREGWVGNNAGGGISSSNGNLALADSTISGNYAYSGGGIAHENAGSLTITNSTISGNIADRNGAGVAMLWDDGPLTITASTISGNSTTESWVGINGGGGVFSHASTIVADSTISANYSASKGGGILVNGLYSSIINSTIADNSAYNGGGGIAKGGTTTITNSTISGNTANNFGTDPYWWKPGGGGVLNANGLTVIEHSTITKNRAPAGFGSGVASAGSATTWTEVHSSIIAGNVGTDVDHVDYCNSCPGYVNSFASDGFNLIGNGNAVDGATFVNNDQTYVADPLLGPLAENGGPTLTHAVLPGSPALDAGDPTAVAGTNVPLLDQRGMPNFRVIGGRIDIGAFERRSGAPVDGDFNHDGVYDQLDIDPLVAQIAAGTNDPAFDMTGDGLVDLAERDVWLAVAGFVNFGPGKSYLVGDANLDGFVDGLDFVAWNEHKFTSVAAWGAGDFNADHLIDGLDFTIWNTNKFQSSHTFVVTNLEAFGFGSLRQANRDANASVLPSEIVFETGLTGTISGAFHIVNDVTITGPGAAYLTIDAQGRSRVFTIDDGQSNSLLNVALSGLTMTGGVAQYGGAILNRENLTIANSTISGNSTGQSSSSNQGGGISNSGGQLTVTGSTISENSSRAGGGISNSDGWVTVINSTISGNIVGQQFSNGSGGGIANYDGFVVIQYSTITDNEAPTNRGGGLANEGSAVTEVRSTIIAGNVNSDVKGSNNSFVSNGYNLIGSGNVGNFNAAGDQTGITDPLLGPLADNGGPTFTHALMLGSPARDAGDPNAVPGVGNTPMYDQRGAPHARIVDDRIDIGAFEVQFPDGDFNDDLLYNIADIDMLVAEIAVGSHSPAFDMTGDGTVDLADRDAWLFEAGLFNLGPSKSYLLGDANLDGFVDGLDFVEWNENKFTSVAAWSAGDFNADGFVDGLDFVIWNANKFQSAHTLTVTNLNDDGVGSLREAIVFANAAFHPSEVVFQAGLSGTLYLTSGALEIAQSMTISGPGAATVTIDAQGGSRVFTIDDGNNSLLQEVILSGLTITGGESLFAGGGIFSRENLTINDTTISENATSGLGDGGGIHIERGTLTLIDSSVSGNTSADNGGGIHSSTTLSLIDSSVSENSAADYGGGIYASDAELSILGSYLVDNSAGDDGGGIFVSGGYLTLTDSTVAGNLGTNGGGISGASANLTVTGTSISGNSATTDGGGIFVSAGYLAVIDGAIETNAATDGGGIANSSGQIHLTNSTVSANSAASRGGGLSSSNGTVSLLASTISGNSADSSGGGIENSGGDLTVTGSTLSANSAANGGGIFNYSANLLVNDSTLSANSVGNSGGGIYSAALTGVGDTTISNSSISGNTAGLQAGAVFNRAGLTTIAYSTIVENAASVAGGVASYGFSAPTVIGSSIVAGNLNSDIDFVEGSFNSLFSGGYNLIGSGNAVDNFDAPGDQTGIADPLLGPLTDNGGPTQTHAILPGSPALDTGDPDALAGMGAVPLHDQRGEPHLRVANGRMDIGAFERQSSTLPDGDFDDDGVYDCLDIDALVAEIAAGTNNLVFDMTGDGLVNLADRDAWLAEAGEMNLGPGKFYLLGDANLDGFVDGLDFVEWNANQFTSLAEWCAGDFNADGFVDGLDFIIWNANKFQSSDAAAEIVLPRLSNEPYEIVDTKRNQVSHENGVDALSVAPPVAPSLAGQRVDALFAMSRRGEDHKDEHPKDDSRILVTTYPRRGL